MTNFTIIVNEAIANGLYTEDQAIEIIKKRGALPLHTFAEWKKRGFNVRKGEHAKLTCFIWRYKKKANAEQENENETEIDENFFYKTKAFFFTADQVERIVLA